MSHVIIYRYEAEDKRGPYNSTCVMIESLWEADMPNTPCPDYKPKEDHVFGFLYRNQARRWFTKDMRREMRLKGVRLRVYQVPLDAIAYSDGHQVAVDKTKAKQLV